MGSLFHLPVLSGLSEAVEAVQAARKAGYELLVTCLDGADNLAARLTCRDALLLLWAMRLTA